jgi:hypothetical protein
MGYIIAAGFGLVFTILVVQLYDEIMEDDSDIYEQDFVYMEDETPVKYDEDIQE